MIKSHEQRPAVLCDLIYSSAELGHGGRHRSMQLCEIVEEAGFIPMLVPVTLRVSNLRCYMEGVKAITRLRVPVWHGWRWTRRWGRAVLRFRAGLQSHSDLRLLLWENSRPEDYLVPRLGREAGLPVYAVPQNIEAMAKGRPVLKPSAYPLGLVSAEMAALRLADRVDAICQAEQWFMSHHGVTAGFLPYHPPSHLAQQLLKVRDKRVASHRSDRLLIMGTTTNPPTRQGMMVLLTSLAKARADAVPVDIIGKDTEKLRAEFDHPRFHFHGRVSSAQLDDLLAGARALLVHQPLATGALTRIPEVLTAGVPVIANPIAARSTGHHQGVYVFEDDDALEELCAAALPMPPVPPVPAEVRSAIRALQAMAAKPSKA